MGKAFQLRAKENTEASDVLNELQLPKNKLVA
jgi:hypothetical protein